MGQMLVNVVFKILNFVAGIFLTPIFSLVGTLFPAVSAFFVKIMTFVNMTFTYVGFVVKLAMIPSACFVPLIALGGTILIFNTTIRIYGLGMAIYHYFKP